MYSKFRTDILLQYTHTLLSSDWEYLYIKYEFHTYSLSLTLSTGNHLANTSITKRYGKVFPVQSVEALRVVRC
jgi:hypothetical protein